VSDVRAKAQLDALYRELPGLDCQRKCDSSCGPIAMTYVEWERIKKRVGYEPVARSIDCPLLSHGLCSVYAIRPMICRLWGIIETMKCPWGCEPDRYLTTREGYLFLARAELYGAKDDESRQNAERMVTELEQMGDDAPMLTLSEALHIRPGVELA
jgi:Fe-S-cluster containining protein